MMEVPKAMSQQTQAPYLYLNDGRLRKVGVELELAGLELNQIVELVQQVVGGHVQPKSEYEASIVGSEVGTVRVEFDTVVFRELKVRKFFDHIDENILNTDDQRSLEMVLASFARLLVPFEIVFDPIPVDQLSRLDQIREAVSGMAEGTSSSAFYAFGLHLNVEVPNLSVATILNYLRAFIILYEELRQLHQIDPMRSMSGFISPFPNHYAKLVLDATYAPTEEQFIADYLTANPSRNRAFDLLPLLTELNESAVRARLPFEKISKRPAFHYRLPNSLINEPDWRIQREWEIWVLVEELANNPLVLARRSRYELKRLQGPLWYWLKRVWRTKPVLSRKPVIAVTGPDKAGFAAWICTWYAVRKAGGIALRLTPEMFADDPTLPPFDGLILGGGADVDPQRYQEDIQELFEEEQRPAKTSWFRFFLGRLVAPLLFVLRSLFALTSSNIDPERDELEQNCLARSLADRLPVLGICRGAQFINIHLGGDLQNKNQAFYGEQGHASTLIPRNPIEVDADSLLYRLVGRTNFGVNSLHNQAVDSLGENIRISAVDASGIVQAIEAKDYEFVLGVQWHPEYLPTSKIQERLFAGLVQAAIRKKHRS